MIRNILLGGGVLAALFAVLIFSGRLPIGGSGANAPVGDVILWGTLPEGAVGDILFDFNGAAKTYRISYREVKEDVFVSRLVDALANGTGPDMILAPYQTILSQTNRLYPFPTASISEKTFKDTYIDGASIFWSPYGALALPVSAEPLIMIYNRTLLSKNGIFGPPTYWDQLADMVPQLTKEDGKGGFIESAIALGTYNNIPYVIDLAMAIVAQLGQLPVLQQYTDSGVSYQIFANTPVVAGGSVTPLATVVRFMTQFSDSGKNTYTWNQFMPLSQDMFVAGKLALYIGYAGDLGVIKARNPKLDVDIATLPQTQGYNTFATSLRMYGIATLRQAKNPNASLTAQAQIAGGLWGPQFAALTGGVTPIRAYVQSLEMPEVIKRSVLVAKGWYNLNPVNVNILFANMISDVISGKLEISEATSLFVSRLYDLYNPI